MVYAHNVTRVTLSGTMFSAGEEWSTGFFLGQESADATPLTQAGIDWIKTKWVEFFTNTTSLINSNWRFTQAKSAIIDTTGHTVLDTVKYSYPTGTVSGGTGTNTHPPQCSLVATLLSDRPRGLASKGRMYLPGFSGSITSNGKISSTEASGVADRLKIFFDALVGHADIPDQLILAAKGTGALPALTAQNDYVETIRVGDVIDTQRRRRNALAEVYQTKVLL